MVLHNGDKIREWVVDDGPFNGTYGQVYVVHHDILGPECKAAIKQLHPYVLDDILVQEAQKQRVVKSPFVVQINDLFFNEEPKSILMEFCPSGLDQYLYAKFEQTRSRIPYEDARKLLHSILQGINDAHSFGVIHGDIKPANIRFGEDHHPKLGDFGAARQLRKETSLMIRGSTNWMAPELLEGGEATRAADYFSFGVLAYLVLSGRHPFYADDPSCLRSEEDNIKNQVFEPTHLAKLRGDVLPKVANLIMELMARDKATREKADKDLKAALLEEPLLEEPRKSATTALRSITQEETAKVRNVYDLSRELFFVHFQAPEAISKLEHSLEGLQWQRFKSKHVSLLADCWSLIAYIHNSQGAFRSAADAATHGLEVDDNHVNSLHTRGYAYIQLGDYPSATADLQRAANLNTDPHKRQQIIDLLHTLRIRKFGEGKRPVSQQTAVLVEKFKALVKESKTNEALQVLSDEGAKIDENDKAELLKNALSELTICEHWEQVIIPAGN